MLQIKAPSREYNHPFCFTANDDDDDDDGAVATSDGGAVIASAYAIIDVDGFVGYTTNDDGGGAVAASVDSIGTSFSQKNMVVAIVVS